MVTPEQLWPPFALTVTAGPLTLQALRDEDMPAGVAELGVQRGPGPNDRADLHTV